jgi:hypothetical protein
MFYTPLYTVFKRDRENVRLASIKEQELIWKDFWQGVLMWFLIWLTSVCSLDYEYLQHRQPGSFDWSTMVDV